MSPPEPGTPAFQNCPSSLILGFLAFKAFEVELEKVPGNP